MKGRHWSIIATLMLLNYLVFSQLIVLVVESNKPAPTPTRTPKPTFTPTFTFTPIPPTPPPTPTPIPTATRVVPPTDTPTPEGGPISTPLPEATATPVPVETRTDRTTHVVQPDENLSQIAQRYGVSVEAIAQVNGLEDPALIHSGQSLIIPAPGEVIPTATPRPPTATPQPVTPAATSQPVTPTATPQPAQPTAAPPAATEVPPTATPVSTIQPVESPYQYRLGRSVTCSPNCGTTGVKGSVYDVNANYVPGHIVRVWTDGWCCGEAETSIYAPYEIMLSPGSKGGHWYVAVYSHDRSTQLSDVVEVDTDWEPCEPSSSGCQWPEVDFVARW